MKLKYLLACVFFLNLNCIYSDNSTDHVLLHMLRDKDQDAKQDVLKLLKTVKRLENKTDVTLAEYQKTLEVLKVKIQDILDNHSSSLDLANQVIFTQQDLLNKYNESNTIKACVITSLMSCLVTWIIMTHGPDILTKSKSSRWFSWIPGFGPKLTMPVAK